MTQPFLSMAIFRALAFRARAVFTSALAALTLAGGLVACAPAQKPVPGLVAAPGETLLRVDIPSRGASALLKRVGRNGGVETWISADNVAISLREGVVVATRGLGFDMMGGDAGNTLEALALPGGDTYRRQMRYLTGDNHSTWIAAGCKMVVGDGRFEERCIARRDRFTNLYWTNGKGQVTRSRQWISPQVGSISISMVAR